MTNELKPGDRVNGTQVCVAVADAGVYLARLKAHSAFGTVTSVMLPDYNRVEFVRTRSWTVWAPASP